MQRLFSSNANSALPLKFHSQYRQTRAKRSSDAKL